MEFIRWYLRCNHCRSEQIGTGVRISDHPLRIHKARLKDTVRDGSLPGRRKPVYVIKKIEDESHLRRVLGRLCRNREHCYLLSAGCQIQILADCSVTISRNGQNLAAVPDAVL